MFSYVQDSYPYLDNNKKTYNQCVSIKKMPLIMFCIKYAQCYLSKYLKEKGMQR